MEAPSDAVGVPDTSFPVTCDVEADESASTVVLETVAAVSNTPITELPPLDDVIDADALDACFAPKWDGTPRDGGAVSFCFGDHLVTVTDGTRVVVQPVKE